MPAWVMVPLESRVVVALAAATKSSQVRGGDSGSNPASANISLLYIRSVQVVPVGSPFVLVSNRG